MSTTGTMPAPESIAGSTPQELEADGIAWRSLHVCPVCSYKWARGNFGPGTSLEVECRQCKNRFVFQVDEKGVERVRHGLAAKPVLADIIRQMNVCLLPRNDGRDGQVRTCATPWSRGALGYGTAIRVKCKRCQRWTNIFK